MRHPSLPHLAMVMSLIAIELIFYSRWYLIEKGMSKIGRVRAIACAEVASRIGTGVGQM